MCQLCSSSLRRGARSDLESVRWPNLEDGGCGDPRYDLRVLSLYTVGTWAQHLVDRFYEDRDLGCRVSGELCLTKAPGTSS